MTKTQFIRENSRKCEERQIPIGLGTAVSVVSELGVTIKRLKKSHTMPEISDADRRGGVFTDEVVFW